MIKVSLKRLENGSALRTPTVDGFCEVLPTVGRGFAMLADPINPEADGRLVATSTTQEILSTVKIDSYTVIKFRTHNSTYQLTVTEES